MALMKIKRRLSSFVLFCILTRPFNKMCTIVHGRAGTGPAQFTCLMCFLCQLCEKYTSKYEGQLSQLTLERASNPMCTIGRMRLTYSLKACLTTTMFSSTGHFLVQHHLESRICFMLFTLILVFIRGNIVFYLVKVLLGRCFLVNLESKIWKLFSCVRPNYDGSSCVTEFITFQA